MKVLYIMNHVDHGGAALALYDLIYEINKSHKDIECVVITSKKNKLNEKLDQLGIENYSFNFHNFMSSYHKPAWLVKKLLTLRYYKNKLILKEIENTLDISSFDIIHTNLDRIDIGAILAKKYHKPHIWHIREHGELDFKLLSVINHPIEYMNSFNSYFVAISKSVKNIWINRGLKNDNTFLVYDGVRSDLYPVSSIRKIDKKINFLFLGGYFENKGQEEAIDAIGLLDKKDQEKINVDMYGSGKDKYISFLQKKINEKNLNSIIHLHKYDPNISKKISKYVVGLTCSAAEGFGRVTVEYMMAGLCPIVSNTGANPEIIAKNVTGLIYKKGDPLSLANQILFVINNPETVQKIREQARKSAHNNFTMKKHVSNIIKIYKTIM